MVWYTTVAIIIVAVAIGIALWKDEWKFWRRK